MLKLIAKANLPTEFGKFTIVGFEDETTSPKESHVALYMGNISGDNPVTVRIHSECLTGDAFGSLKCDCGAQLHTALKMISEEGRGVLIYHRAEGRGIGIINKIRAYALQDEGLDTVEANLKLGFQVDERNFKVCADILNLLNIHTINLLTNNLEKVMSLEKEGIIVAKRIPLVVGTNTYNIDYLNTKSHKMGHILPELS